MIPVEFQILLEAFALHDVEFIIIGGVAASLHGSARVTSDLDILYRRTDANILHLVKAIEPFKPYLRGAPPGLPFRFDVETIKRGLNFTLSTQAGDLDLLGEVTGGGGYDVLFEGSVSVKLFGIDCRCLNLEQLLAAKRAAGRPKDFEVIAELESLREEQT